MGITVDYGWDGWPSRGESGDFDDVVAGAEELVSEAAPDESYRTGDEIL